ncbi:hypothetical protein HBB16_16045 [Pseudonocardia sp. MCCB 268]|nr:hypothetical protein [Pseudonocardia cytotoxica]
MLDRVPSTEDRNRLEPLLDAMGTAAPAEVDPPGPPTAIPAARAVLLSGDRIDDVEFHPAYDG